MGLNYYQIKKNILKARKLVIRSTNIAGSGHPGGSFSMAEILGCLFGKHLRFDPRNPQWIDRDRLVLSKGHPTFAIIELNHLKKKLHDIIMIMMIFLIFWSRMADRLKCLPLDTKVRGSIPSF